jgi:thioredoxin-like negative regulator of GroEL
MLGSLVVIHPRNAPSPVPGERLARIRRFLAQGQVEAAVEEVKRLPGAAQSKAWLDGAQRYIATRQALDTLEAAALQGNAAALPPAGR